MYRSALSRLRLAVLIVPAFSTPVQAQVPSASVGQIEEWVGETIQGSEIPGLGIGIVAGNSVLLLRGFGVRDIQGPELVDEHTAFQVASLTKSMTATLLAMLVDEGRLTWDDPVQAHLPEFGLADEYVAERLTIRDVLAMRSGIQGGDSIALYSSRTPSEILERMHGLEAPRFRAAYGDAPNLMYFLAGEVVRGASGTPYADFLEDRLLVPLRMLESTTSLEEFDAKENAGIGHVRRGGVVETTSPRNVTNVMSAAGLMTTASDLVNWIRLNLDSGMFEERRLVTEEALAETRRPQNILTPAYQALFNPHGLLNAYGFGWVISEYRGRTLVEHGGSLPGYGAVIAMIPEDGFGLVLLSNLSFGLGASTLLELKFGIIDKLLEEMEGGV